MPLKEKKADTRWGTIQDTMKSFLGIVGEVKGFIPEPAGSIVGALAGTGLTVIEMLQVNPTTVIMWTSLTINFRAWRITVKER